jgi:uncharacterized protein YqgC (DUF456 family)
MLEIILVTLGIILTIAGIIGCIVPGLPGPPLNFIALILVKLTYPDSLSWLLILVFAVLTIAITIFDYVVPTYGAKYFGVSKYGIWGSVIGMIAGIFFFPPFGMFIGIIIGAAAGELIGGKSHWQAMKAGTATFFLNLFMMGLKLILSIIMSLVFFFVMADPFFKFS